MVNDIILDFLSFLLKTSIIAITGILIVWFIVRKIRDSYNRLQFSRIEAEIKYYLDRAYNIVYAEDLSVYVASNMSLSMEDDEFIALLRKLINIFKYSIGSKQYEYYIEVFGSEDDLIDYINLYFTEAVYRDVVKVLLSKEAQKHATNIKVIDNIMDTQ
jgi:hypothetical protein